MGQYYTDPGSKMSFWVPSGWTPEQMWGYILDTHPNAQEYAATSRIQPAQYTQAQIEKEGYTAPRTGAGRYMQGTGSQTQPTTTGKNGDVPFTTTPTVPVDQNNNQGQGQGQGANTVLQPTVTRYDDPTKAPAGPVQSGNGTVGNLKLRTQDGREIVLPINGAQDKTTVDYYTRNGWTPVNEQDQTYKVFDYQGGQVFVDPTRKQGFTLDQIMGTGGLSLDQTAAMNTPEFKAAVNQALGVTGTDTGTGGTGTTGTTNSGTINTNPGTGSQFAGVGGDLSGLSTAINQLVQEVFNRIPGAEALFGGATQFANNLMNMLSQDRALRDQILPTLLNPSEFEQSMRGLLESTIHQRDTQVSRTLEPAMGEIGADISERDRGLSESAKAALYGTAKDNAVQGYDAAAQELRQQLAQRGAMGGELPGSEGDIIRGFAPLLSARENAVTAGERGTVLADEQAKQASRDRALQAAGLSGSLMNTLGSIYNPNPIMGAVTDAAGQRTNLFNAVNNAYNGSNLISGANAGLSNSADAMRVIAQMLGIPFTGTGQMADILGNKQGTDWMKLLIGSVLSGMGGAKNSSGQSIWDTILNGIGTVFGGSSTNPVATGDTRPTPPFTTPTQNAFNFTDPFFGNPQNGGIPGLGSGPLSIPGNQRLLRM